MTGFLPASCIRSINHNKDTRMKLSHSLPLLLLAASINANADGFYVLGEVTHSVTTLKKSTFNDRLTAAGATGLSSSDDGKSNQWRLQGGYQFNPNFAVEAGYIDLGKAKYNATYAGGNASGELKAGGFDLAVLGILPIMDDLSILGKAGIIDAKAKSSLSANAPATSASGNDSTNEVLPLFGIGASYKVSQAVDVRVDLDHVSGIGKSGKTGEMNSTMLSLGAAYHF